MHTHQTHFLMFAKPSRIFSQVALLQCLGAAETETALSAH